MDEVKLWTLLIEGGLPFQLSLPNHPSLYHDGVRTLGKVFGSHVKILEIQEEIRNKFASSVYVYTEEATEEMKQIRQSRLTGDGLEDID